jgi:putative flippase GtrA
LNKKLMREIFMYLVFGVLTTIVSILVYKGANHAFGLRYYLLSNVISWVVAVAFAFVTNKLWVFESKSWAREIIARELTRFAGARLFSLGAEQLGLFLLIDIARMGASVWDVAGYALTGYDLAKFIMQIVVVLLNYVFSKRLIFKSAKGERG